MVTLKCLFGDIVKKQKKRENKLFYNYNRHTNNISEKNAIEVQISLYVYKPEIRAGADLGKIFVYISIQNSDTEIFKILT